MTTLRDVATTDGSRCPACGKRFPGLDRITKCADHKFAREEHRVWQRCPDCDGQGFVRLTVGAEQREQMVECIRCAGEGGYRLSDEQRR